MAYLTFASKDEELKLASASKDEELKVRLVEIAIGILTADPKQDVTPARGWALDVIQKNSGVPFSAEDREALLHKPLANAGVIWKKELVVPWDAMDWQKLFNEKHAPMEK